MHRLMTVVFVLLTALPASAQEHEATGLSPFAGNVGNAVWTLTIFVIVVAVLGKFAWGPILQLLQDREASGLRGHPAATSQRRLRSGGSPTA